MIPDLLLRRKTHFILWRPGCTEPAPRLLLGLFARIIPTREGLREIPLAPNPDFPDLWEVAAADCGLIEGQVYAYWFKVKNVNPYGFTGPHEILYCTDPLAATVDRRPSRLAPIPPNEGGVASGDPASVVRYDQGQLIPCNADGATAVWDEAHPTAALPKNNQLVIYELPTRWTQTGQGGKGIGCFRDSLALVEPGAIAPDFAHVPAVAAGQSHLKTLGVNCLELLPPADSDDVLEWGYGTANFFAADDDLGRSVSQEASSAMTDLIALVAACHRLGMRVFIDAVMAFARGNPYTNINFLDFMVQWGVNDPEQGDRDGFGGDLFKYNFWVEGYHPLSGKKDWFVPAREYMKLYIAHWLEQYHIDGVRLDSVNNVANYDFLQEFRDFARAYWRDRGGDDEQFLVVGEELSVPIALIHQNRLDGLWNEKFKQIARQVILGKPAAGDRSFEWSVRKLIDCRYLGFTDGTQAINYLTSHDVGGFGNERLYNYLLNQGITDLEHRIKLAFVCLLTAVGIPMILAGDEFADQHDFDLSDEHSNHKQIDPVNFDRLQDPWRQRLCRYVARLVKFRTQAPGLAVNDTQFLQIDYTEGKQVIVWQRGMGDDAVIVVANFSDYGTPDPFAPTSEYCVNAWPQTPPGKHWWEVTQDRMIFTEWIGREPIFPWEAKVYTLIDA